MKKENLNIVLKKDLKSAFKYLGLQKGQNIIVHTSLKSLGFVCGGEQIIIESLLESVGEEGTIIMPTQSWKNLDPERKIHPEAKEEWYQLIRDNYPGYDKDITPTNTMGKTAEMFRKWPGAFRSDHPAPSFAAVGKNADYIVKNHGLEDIFGESSPLGKLYRLDGYILLIGVDYDKCTAIHLADDRAVYKSKHKEKESSAIIINGERKWVTYETLYVDGEDFIDIGRDFELSNSVKKTFVGNSELRFIKMRDLVDFSVKWIEKNRK